LRRARVRPRDPAVLPVLGAGDPDAHRGCGRHRFGAAGDHGPVHPGHDPGRWTASSITAVASSIAGVSVRLPLKDVPMAVRHAATMTASGTIGSRRMQAAAVVGAALSGESVRLYKR